MDLSYILRIIGSITLNGFFSKKEDLHMGHIKLLPRINIFIEFNPCFLHIGQSQLLILYVKSNILPIMFTIP